MGAPEVVSHDALLAALEMRSAGIVEDGNSLYETQLRHRLLTLARKARLEVAAHEITGLPAAELSQKSTSELLRLLDSHRGNLKPGDVNLLRFWW
jgi:hypothetical protein